MERRLFCRNRWLKKHLQFRLEITSESTRRKEILELPEIALREAMVNAVCHRDYLEQGAQVMVGIFDIEIPSQAGHQGIGNLLLGMVW